MDEKTALVQTVDIITPVVDDPYLFGQIAAANSLSDIFAMGGNVKTALNIVCYDNCNVSKEALKEILEGGLTKTKEAGGSILGGHTIKDIEMKYGLAVTGLVNPNNFIKNDTIQEGDDLILTKPLGLGVTTTAIKADMASDLAIKRAGEIMSQLNQKAAELALRHKINAMTDVTGFGLLGHLCEMNNNRYSIDLFYDKISFLKEAFKYAELGLFPGGAYKNRRHFLDNVEIKRQLSDNERMLLFDPQTSGGLLISCPEKESSSLIEKLKNEGFEESSIIAKVHKKNKGNKIKIL